MKAAMSQGLQTHSVCNDDSPVELATRLECGEILVFAPGLLPLPEESDQAFLREQLSNHIKLKNISYHPSGDYLSGIKGKADVKNRTQQILRQRACTVTDFLAERLPYAARWHLGKVNYRPLQEQGRNLSVRASNERLHVDAFPSGATHGSRMLRFFTNLNPSQARHWISAGHFEQIYTEFGAAAGLPPKSLDQGIFERTYSGLLRMLGTMGLPQAALADTSPYDRAMLRLHNHLKEDDAFQKQADRQSSVSFEPFYSWAVMTDIVSHACISGQHALVNTFYVPLECCVQPEVAPFRVIEQQLHER